MKFNNFRSLYLIEGPFCEIIVGGLRLDERGSSFFGRVFGFHSDTSVPRWKRGLFGFGRNGSVLTRRGGSRRVRFLFEIGRAAFGGGRCRNVPRFTGFEFGIVQVRK